MALYDEPCAYAGPLGLLPEQIDPQSGAFLGNYPQAFICGSDLQRGDPGSLPAAAGHLSPLSTGEANKNGSRLEETSASSCALTAR